MMECLGLSKSYGFNKQALNGASLTFGPGEIVGLFGENGAGKTTLLKCLLVFPRAHGIGSPAIL